MITSMKLRVEEREVLEQLAVAQGVSLAEVWRRALRVYASQSGLSLDEGGPATQSS